MLKSWFHILNNARIEKMCVWGEGEGIGGVGEGGGRGASDIDLCLSGWGARHIFDNFITKFHPYPI